MNEIRDPVHNFILFDDFEKRLIDSEPVQRLKHIKQLALTCEVYPGASHSRFEHSLGTMELATQAFNMIVRKNPRALAKLEWKESDKENYRQVLRIGALLHDIGHAPFSHAPEALLPEGYAGHEDFSKDMILSDLIRPLLRKGPVTFDADQVVAVALGPERSSQEDPKIQLLQELVAGELGADRIDYLVRDALHTGAAAGRFDYHRLLNTLTVIEQPGTDSPVLALEEGGVHAAEALLLSRYFMFLQVYFHRVRRIYDIHLADFLSCHLPGGRFPAELEKYIQYTDDAVQLAIAEAASQNSDLAQVACRLVGRHHYRRAFEVTAKEREKDIEFFPRLAEHVRERFDDLVRTDEVGKEPHTLEEGDLYIVNDDGTAKDIFEVSQVVGLLKPIWVGRIYARADVRDEVKEACKEFVSQEGAAP
jgi:HD superfamily phosphohydrolase